MAGAADAPRSDAACGGRRLRSPRVRRHSGGSVRLGAGSFRRVAGRARQAAASGEATRSGERRRGLRKPSVAAWAVNQLVRTQPKALQALFASGDDLARAQAQAAAGKGGAMRCAPPHIVSAPPCVNWSRRQKGCWTQTDTASARRRWTGWARPSGPPPMMRTRAGRWQEGASLGSCVLSVSGSVD